MWFQRLAQGRLGGAQEERSEILPEKGEIGVKPVAQPTSSTAYFDHKVEWSRNVRRGMRQNEGDRGCEAYLPGWPALNSRASPAETHSCQKLYY